MDVEKDDVENCLYFGTPLEDAQSCLLSRKQPLTNRAPRVWEQIVTDERGRRRLHGAFTGGFSAGYFNTVDTKEGFTPKTFKTSRSNRAEDRKQEIHEFYDKDELEELQRVDVVTHDGYDTFSSMRSEKIKERTEAEAAARPIIPGGVITEFIEGVAESIGVKLLQKMGWRQGKGIGEAFKSATEQAVELDWGPDASLAQEGTQFWKQKPKMNVHGLGFDPFRGSRDFEKAKAEIHQKSKTKRPRGIAFGVGVLEETDTFGEMVDYVDNSIAQDRINYYEISDDSDDGGPPSNRDQTKLLTHESRTFNQGDSSFIPGFHLSTVLKEQRIFQLPVVPPGFTGRIQRLEKGDKGQTEGPGKLPVPAAQIPIDLEKKKLIDSVAVFVAKGGYPSEELVRTQHQGDGLYSFLFGGENCEYYRWKLLDVKVTFQKLGVEFFGQRQTPLTADDRGFLLGDEKLIEESKLESKNKAVAHLDIQGVPEADRSRVKTALNSNFVKGSRETGLQVEEVIPGLRAPRPKDQIEDKKEDPSLLRNQRTGDGLVPVRWFLDWHPTPLVYKRFKIQDPFKGQIQEAEPQSKFMSYEAQLNEVKEEDVEMNKLTSDANEVDITLPPPEYTEPPLDIFKSIFDASDQEEETEPVQKSDSPIQEASIPETKTIPQESSPKQDPPPPRKKLRVSSDESSEEEVTGNVKKSAKTDETSSESFDEEIFSGLSTSEFKKLLKTLKKEQKRKSRSRKDRKREKKKKKNRKSKV